MFLKQRLAASWCSFIFPCLFPAGSFASTPEIQSVKGALDKGEYLVVEGSNFSSKGESRPLFVWDADKGVDPRPVSRKSSWAGALNGELSTEIVAPNSEQAFRFDHGNSTGAALAGVEFQSDRLFVFRRTYEDFNTSEDFAIRTRVTNISGEIQKGQTVRGLKSGATGVVLKVTSDGDSRKSIFYTKSGGSINQDNPVDFDYGEEMETDTATFENTEGSNTYPTGTYRTFNFKTMRLWNQAGRNNSYIGTGQNQKYDVMPEHTDGKLWNGGMEKSLRQRPGVWKSEELFYEVSSLNEHDGRLDFRFDNTQYYDHGFRTRTDQDPGKYDIIYQSQVSNGAQPNSYIYYDHIYIDDSWHHVAICNEKLWSECKDKSLQVPLEWTTNSIKLEYNPRHLNASENIYLYVVDGQGEVNAEGFNLCADCPSTPRAFTIE